MKRTLFIGMLGFSALIGGYAQQGEGARKGRVVREPLVHDPVMAKEGDTYYLYSTGHNVSSFSSKDLSEWTIRHGVFPAPPQWAMDSIPEYKGHTWHRISFIIRGIIISFILVPLSERTLLPLAMPIAVL